MVRTLPNARTGFVTLTEAARMANRSYSWAWDRAAVGRFDVRRFAGSRSMFVTVESLEAVLVAEGSRTVATDNRRPGSRKHAHLRVVSSTQGERNAPDQQPRDRKHLHLV